MRPMREPPGLSIMNQNYCQTRNHRRNQVSLCFLACLIALWAIPLWAADTPSGLPVPRFVSLGEKVNVRNGPGTDHPILWQYRNAQGSPVEVIAETAEWRRIRDWDGKEGWVYAPLLKGRRFLMIKGDGTDRPVALRSGPDASATVRALAQVGVMGRLDQCQGEWCLMTHSDSRGWVHRTLLWGIYPDEFAEE